MLAKKRISLSELTFQDVVCPICLSVLIEPVTMPCSHSLCMSCFQQNVAETALACPLCRMRISVWVRRNTKSKRLVNTRLWQMIKEKFAAKVEARLQGVDDADDEDYVIPEPRVCAPGELRQEYEALVEQEQKELASRRSQEDDASSKLILQLQEDEKMKLRHRRAQEESLCKDDEVLAQQMKEAENIVLEQKLKEIQLLCGSDEEMARQIEMAERTKLKPPPKPVATPTRGPMDVYIGQKTPRSQGKLLLPEMMSQSSSKSSSEAPGNQSSSSSPKTSLDYRSTPTSSVNTHNFYNGGSISGLHASGPLPRSNSGSSNDSTDSRVGRQLREIISSQSSESESEDAVYAAQVKKKQQINNSGKENMRSAKNASPSKAFSPKKSRLCSPSKYDKKKCRSKIFKHKFNSSEIHSMEEMTPEDILDSSLAEDSDETDIDEDDPDYGVRRKGKGKPDMSVRESQRRESLSSKQETSFEEVEGEVTKNGAEEDGDDYNSSMDYSLIFSNEDVYAESLEKLKAEQLRVEERLRQEENDRRMAQELQKQMDLELRQVNRSRGSEDEYVLRNRRPVASTSKASSRSKNSTSTKRERQTTLKEALAKRHKRS